MSLMRVCRVIPVDPFVVIRVMQMNLTYNNDIAIGGKTITVTQGTSGGDTEVCTDACH